MKVLFFFDGYRQMDDRTRVGFIAQLQPYCSLAVYGPKEHQLNPWFAPIEYSKSLTSKNILDLFQPDVLLFYYYGANSSTGNKGFIDWLPDDICKQGVPSIIFEEDHYTEETNEDDHIFDKHEEWKFSLVARRHYHTDICNIPSVWIPFSASAEEFIFDVNSLDSREKKICFAGSMFGKYYESRLTAVEKLGGVAILAPHIGNMGGDYLGYIKKYVGAVSCGGSWLHTVLAKHFELPLVGTALLTNWLYEYDMLFEGKDCLYVYKDDGSDVVRIAEQLIEDDIVRKAKIVVAQDVVKRKHTDKHRVEELRNILLALINNKEIPRVWGQ